MSEPNCWILILQISWIIIPENNSSYITFLSKLTSLYQAWQASRQSGAVLLSKGRNGKVAVWYKFCPTRNLQTLLESCLQRHWSAQSWAPLASSSSHRISIMSLAVSPINIGSSPLAIKPRRSLWESRISCFQLGLTSLYKTLEHVLPSPDVLKMNKMLYF